MKIKLTLVAMLAMCVVWLPDRAAAGWSAVTAAPINVSTMMLLSDGTVMCQNNGGTGWRRLVPDSSGNYSSGRWTNDINSMTYSRTYFASDMLQNGKVFVAGGELGSGSSYVEIYNPVANSWADYGPAYFGGMADADSVVLNDGQVLIAPQAASGSYGNKTFTFDPSGGTFSGSISPVHSLSEDCWVKLADDSILTVDSDQSSYGALTAERYVPGTGWVSAGTLPVSIWVPLPNGGIVAETGQGFLLPNGNAIFFGGNGHTAIYQTASGTWIQGPDIPGGQVCADAPGAMMPNGKILLCVSSALSDNANPNSPSDWPSPISFYEYDYSIGSIGGYTHLLGPDNASYTRSDQTYYCRMLVLPSGNVLFTDGGSQLYIFQTDSAPLAAGQPTINKVSWNSDASLHITGTLFDGISEGAAYGDDQQMATDFPIVRFTDGSGNVYYGRTHDWSSTSIKTGGQVMSTEVTVPDAVLDFPNSFSLQVIANGNASAAVTFYSPVWVDFNYSGFPFQLGWYPYPYNTLAGGVSAVASGGSIVIKSSNSHETMTISKPMTISSVYGPSTIGH